MFMAAVMGSALQANAATTIYTADFEDGEVNPGRIPLTGLINTLAYPATQPAAFADASNVDPLTGDAYGWQNKAHFFATGDTTIIDTASYTGLNCAQVVSRTLRSDIEHTLVADSIYTFTFWMMIPDNGNNPDLTFYNKVVCKDQTNLYLFVDTGDEYITAPGYDIWFSRKVTFSTVGYANVGVPIDFRFGIWLSDPAAESFAAYTDNWSVTYEPANTFLNTSLIYNPVADDISVAWSDIDKDGLTDLYAGSLAPGEAGLFMNSNPFDPNLAPADDPNAGPGANHPGLMVDYDNDGDIDMYTSQAGAHASRNNSDGTFTEINGGLLTTSASTTIAGVTSECHAWGDFDNDGYLDYYRSGWEVAYQVE